MTTITITVSSSDTLTAHQLLGLLGEENIPDIVDNMETLPLDSELFDDRGNPVGKLKIEEVKLRSRPCLTEAFAAELAKGSDVEVMLFFENPHTLGVVWRELVKRGLAYQEGEGWHRSYRLNKRGEKLRDEVQA